MRNMKEQMTVYVVHAFADRPGGGNPAGVVFLQGNECLSAVQMQKKAAELNFSETAFIERKGEKEFFIRFFTPVCEVPLCGHAAIASFSFLRQSGVIEDGLYQLLTAEERLKVEVSEGVVWMEMAVPVLEETLDAETIREICGAYELEWADLSQEVPPRIVRAGIRDIHICVKNREVLLRAKQHPEEVCAISKRYDAAGIHMSCLGTGGDGVTAYCSNFAPYYGIEEECATGTSNAGLTFYLYQQGLLSPERENCFLQGEHMGRPSKVYSRVLITDHTPAVWIGGTAVIVRT